MFNSIALTALTSFVGKGNGSSFSLYSKYITYVLDPNLKPFLEPKEDDSDKVKAKRKKRKDDKIMCRGYILNTLSDRLYDLYNSVESPTEIWNTLEYKYKTEKEGTTNSLS